MLFLLKLMLSIILLPIILIVVWISLTIIVVICEVFADSIKAIATITKVIVVQIIEAMLKLKLRKILLMALPTFLKNILNGFISIITSFL